MLVELSMVEQRYQAVREVLDSAATITEVAKHYGVDRRTLHRWLTRYAIGGLEALVTQSTRPDTCPHQMDPVIESRLVERRRLHPTWGPRTLATKLRAEFGGRPLAGRDLSRPRSPRTHCPGAATAHQGEL